MALLTLKDVHVTLGDRHLLAASIAVGPLLVLCDRTAQLLDLKLQVVDCSPSLLHARVGLQLFIGRIRDIRRRHVGAKDDIEHELCRTPLGAHEQTEIGCPLNETIPNAAGEKKGREHERDSERHRADRQGGGHEPASKRLQRHRNDGHKAIPILPLPLRSLLLLG